MTGSENKFESIFIKGKERHLHKGDDILVKLLMEFFPFFLCIQRKNEEAEKKIELFMMGKVPDTNGTLNL